MTTHSSLDIVVSGTESDAHTWNLVHLQMLFEGWGHHVENLGPCVTGEDIVHRYADRAPDLIVLSSVNGRGEGDGLRALAALRASPRLAGTPVVLGGNLGAHGADAPDRGEGGPGTVARRLLAAGFAAVCLEHVDLRALEEFVGSVAPRHARTGGHRAVRPEAV
jgi:methylaspartate mutase sigma subunit